MSLSELELQSLQSFDGSRFARGRSRLVEAVWLLLQTLFVSSPIPGSRHRRFLLRMFGAKLGRGVVLKPGIRVKFPWRLTIGDYSWIGEDVWIDNLDRVDIGSNCCISQGVYLCTGSHDWSSTGFDLITKPILIHDRSWLAARSSVGPGVTIGEAAVLAFGSVATSALTTETIYQGVPAKPVKHRLRKGS